MGLRPLRSCFGVYTDLIISTIVDVNCLDLDEFTSIRT